MNINKIVFDHHIKMIEYLSEYSPLIFKIGDVVEHVMDPTKSSQITNICCNNQCLVFDGNDPKDSWTHFISNRYKLHYTSEFHNKLEELLSVVKQES